MDCDPCYEYRDTFLYQWARERLDWRPIKYRIIIALDGLNSFYLNNCVSQLKKIPLI